MKMRMAMTTILSHIKGKRAHCNDYMVVIMMVIDYNDGDNDNDDRKCYLTNHCHPILLVLWHLGIGSIGSNDCHDDGNGSNDCHDNGN